MATRGEVLSWVRSLADRGIGVDADGAYGMQCVDLPNMVAQKFFGRSMWGNGIDMLRAGQGLGWRTTGVELPRAGAIFCMRTSAHPYGHTGFVVNDPDGNGNFQTVEQNVDGGFGGPARYRVRSLRGGGEQIIGFIYPPYSDGVGGGLGAAGDTATEVPPERTSMDFTFNIKGDPANWEPNTIYYYNGAINEVQPVHNLEELKYLRAIWRDTHGRDLKHYDWNNMVPVYVRVFSVTRPSGANDNIRASIDKILRQIGAAP